MITKISGMIRPGCCSETRITLDTPHYARAKTRSGRLPLSTKIYQGIGALPDTFKNFAFSTFLLFYYNQVLGVRAVLASVAIMVALVIDALTDPMVGSFSDNLRSRLGRRHPLMYAASLPLGVFLYLRVFAAGRTCRKSALFAWLVDVRRSQRAFRWRSISCRGTRCSRNFRTTTRNAPSIITFRYLVGWIGGVIFTFFTWTLHLPELCRVREGAAESGRLSSLRADPRRAGRRGRVPDDAPDAQRDSVSAATDRRTGAVFVEARVLAEVLLALRNRDFLVLFMTLLTASAIGGTTEALNIYVQTYFWELNGEALRWFALAILGFMAAFAVIPIAAGALRQETSRHLRAGVPRAQRRGDDRAAVSRRAAGQRLADAAAVADHQRDHSNRRVHGRRDHVRIDGRRRARCAGTRPPGGARKASSPRRCRSPPRRPRGSACCWAVCCSTTSSAFRAARRPSRSIPPPSRMLGLIAGIGLPLLFLFPFSLISRYRITRETHAEIRRQLDERHRATNGADAAASLVNPG